MKILAVADEECSALWDFYVPGRLKDYDLILSSGDLKASYLSFLVTMAKCPVMYVHGNHDTNYEHKPPEGCDCIDGRLVIYKGLWVWAEATVIARAIFSTTTDRCAAVSAN